MLRTAYRSLAAASEVQPFSLASDAIGWHTLLPAPIAAAQAPVAEAPTAAVDLYPAPPGVVAVAITDIDPMLPPVYLDGSVTLASAAAATASSAAYATGPVGPTLAQEVTYLNGLNPDGTLSSDSYWGFNSGTAIKWGSGVAGTSATISYFFQADSAFTATEQATFLKAFAMWESVADVHFVLAADAASANVLLRRGTDGGAYEDSVSYFPGSGTTVGTHAAQAIINIDTNVVGFDLSGSFDVVGGYGLSTVIHEVGHLLGLGHGGPYNGAVVAATQQNSAYDQRLYTTMSYISYYNTDAKYAGSYPVASNWGVSADRYLRVAPHSVQELDILAIQQLYGASKSTPLVSGTTYGFHTTITGALKDFFDFTVNTKPVVTLYNQGTGNTLDLSGYAMAQTINLNAGAFSSVGGLTNNLGIAFDTRIDALVGGSGNDVIVANANGDTIDGGAGIDTVSFVMATAGVTVSLASAAGAQATGGAGTVLLTAIENLTGSSFADMLTGDAGANVLDGGLGNDTLDGGDGIDTASYASAIAGVTVSLALAGAQNTIAAGIDTLVAIENLLGSAFDDVLGGSAGDNVITGGGGSDTASYADATAAVTVSLAISGPQNTIGAGSDTLVQVSGLIGSIYADTLTGNALGNTLNGGGGADTLNGGAGDDIYIVGNAGVTIVEDAGGGTDTVRTDISGYVLPDNVENLVYTGTVASAVIAGNAGNNTLSGSATLASYFDLSAGGDDTATGGSGNDLFFMGGAFTAADHIDGGAGTNDQIGLQGDYTGARALVLGATTISGIETIAALAGYSYDITTVDATVAAGGTLTIYGSSLAAGNALTFNGAAETNGSFVVYGGLGLDHIVTGAGSDGIYFGRDGRFDALNDFVDGGAGNDQMALDGSYTATITRAAVVNVETLVLLDGSTASADYRITLAADWTQAGEAHSVYAVGVRNAVYVDGALEAGALKIWGGSGGDTLIGGSGGTWFDGGAGGDTMTGGAGIDTYYYGRTSNSMGVAHDTIVAFDAAQDKIDLSVAVTAIDAARSGTLGADSFDDDLTAALTSLGAQHAVEFTVTGGGALDGRVFEVIDANGVAGYQAGQDMVIELVNPIGHITDAAAVFI